jgi:ectoine hydroxylase-related dioxygenase (phytanoyl-CoA dioxygenase family)
VVEGVLDAGCLVSSLSSISIDPGETAQPLHADDTLLNLPRPHPPLVCNSMWALTDFTAQNGATRVVPGSHRWSGQPAYGARYDSVPAEMAQGSVLIWNGSLWHGGGANESSGRRVGIAMNYCAGFIRQQENQQLGIPTAPDAPAGPPKGIFSHTGPRPADPAGPTPGFSCSLPHPVACRRSGPKLPSPANSTCCGLRGPYHRPAA